MVEIFRQLQTVREELDTLARLLLEADEEQESTPAAHPEEDGTDGTGEYLTVQEVANRYHVCPATIYRWARLGIFPKGHSWGPRTRRWKKTDLEL